MSTDMQVYQEFRGFDAGQEALLKERLQESNVKQRPGAKGRKLSYVKGDYAIATANRIFGFGKWGYKVISRMHEICKDENKGEIEYYTADIELLVVGSMFPFPGDGVGIVTAPFTVEMHEKARKEAVTDALKRALRHYGDQFGLSLYDEDNYIETEDGSVKQVKDVGKQQSNGYQQAKRVVDAAPPLRNGDGTPAMPVQDEQSDVLKQMLAKCKQRAFAVGIKTRSQWEAFRGQYAHAESDEQVTIAGVGAMNGELTIREKAAKTA